MFQAVTRVSMSAANLTLSAIRFSLTGLGKTAAGALAAALLNFSSANRAFHLFTVVSACR